MPQILFDAEFPTEIKPAFEAVLLRHIAIVPDWCYTVKIWSSSRGEDGNYNLASKALHEYRRASLWVYAGWLNSSETVRDMDVVHELFHILLAPAHEYALTQLKALLKDAPAVYRESIIGTFKDHCEMVCEDMVRAYLTKRLLPPEADRA